ncbi:MAG: APC family permease [Chloroflexota bacterium]
MSQQLHRQLSFFEVLAMPVALMAPTAGMGLNTPFVAASAGVAVPFVFIISTLGIACVAAAFIRFARRFNDAGSVYGLTKAAVGPRYGFIAGWCLALTYVSFVGTLTAGFVTFFNLLLQGLFGFTISWPLLLLVGGGLVWVMAHRNIRLSARTMMLFEFVSIALMLVLAVVIVGKGGAQGHSLSASPLTTAGVPFSGLSAALVFGFLTFIGFEGAVVLGEESNEPHIAIPLAVFSSVVIAGVVFIGVSYAQTIGFGLGPAGTKAYAASAAPNTDLGRMFVGHAFELSLDLGAALSTFACALASANGASRVLYSLSRDGRLPAVLKRVHVRHNSPYTATAASMIIGLAMALAFVGHTSSPSDVYGWLGALATLAVIVAYGMTSIASLLYFWREDVTRKAFYHVVPVIVAVALLGYTFYSQIIPIPPSPLKYWPYLMVAYLFVGAGILFFQRGLVVSRTLPGEVSPILEANVPIHPAGSVPEVGA